MQNELGQFNYTKRREHKKLSQNIPFFPDIFDVYSGPNKHIDMIPSKSCQTSSDNSLEYQQGEVWLQMSSKMAHLFIPHFAI